MIPPLCFYGLVLVLCGNCCSLFCDGLGRCGRGNGGSCGLFYCRLCGGLGCCGLCGTGLATVLGVGYGVLVKDKADFAKALQDCIDSQKVCFLEVIIDRYEDVLPMVPVGGALNEMILFKKAK